MVTVRNEAGGRERQRNQHYDAVVEYFEQDPTSSLRKAADATGASYSACQKIMKDDGQHPYKFRRVHEISKNCFI